MTTNQKAIRDLFKIGRDVSGNLPLMPGIFPDYPAPVIRNAGDDREMVPMRWGMPPPRTGGPPMTNVRNTSSPHWRGWLKSENRCLVRPSGDPISRARKSAYSVVGKRSTQLVGQRHEGSEMDTDCYRLPDGAPDRSRDRRLFLCLPRPEP
jgi:hypothetical protein